MTYLKIPEISLSAITINFESEALKELSNILTKACYMDFKTTSSYREEISCCSDAISAYFLSSYKKQKQKSMIDFTIPGTKLPIIPKGTPYFTKNGSNFSFVNTHELYSYGHYNLYDAVYINCEEADYDRGNYYLVKLSTIQELAKQQNMKKEKEIIGYKLSLLKYEKAAAIIGRGNSDLSMFNTNSIYQTTKTIYYNVWEKTINNLKDAGVLDEWFEPVYEEDKIMISNYEVLFFKAHTTIDGYMFTQQFWEAARIISGNTKAKIMIGCSKQFDVSLDTINKILNKLNQQQ